MMQVSHWSSGALVGSFAPSPAAAAALGVASHFALDSIPHYWPQSFAEQTRFAVADYAAALGMFAAFAATAESRSAAARHRRAFPLLGVAGSATVDLVLVGVAPAYRSRVGRWHVARQPHRTDRRWLWTDALVTAACVAVLLARR